MSKRKKQRKVQHSPKRPSAKLMRAIEVAWELYEEGEAEQAQQQLSQLARQYPGSKAVLLALLEVSDDIQDWRTYAYYGEQLLPLEHGEDQAETLNNLVYAYIKLLYPALAWQHARELATRHPQFEQIEQVKLFEETTEVLLLDDVEATIDSAVFTQDEKLEILVLNDRVRFLTESGYPKEAIRSAETLLGKAPNMLPVLNNLSLSQFLIGDTEQAITTAQNVLRQDPDNCHALGNLVRYTYLSAQFDEAQAYARRLQQITSDNPDLENIQAEAFAFLGEDGQVWAAYERAKAKGSEQTPLFLHFAAVASYRLGHEKRAWQLWQQAVELLPEFDIAEECLAEKMLPVGERDIPWYWPFNYWFSQDIGELLDKFLGKNTQRMSPRSVERGMKSLLEERPYLPRLFPHMLERGDRHSREFVLNFIRIAKTPELLQTLYDFMQGRYGADDIRMEAMQFISQNYPDMLPEDRQVPMWINGKQTELLAIGFEITDEPQGVEGISETILDKHEAAYDFLMDDQPEEAELLLHEIIAEMPDFCPAYNHLALAYNMQGEMEKARALVEETYARFPDYFFARVALARMKVQEKRIEEARDLVLPLLRLPKLHISEFRALAKAQMEIALADSRPEEARTWLEMWRQIDGDDPELIEWDIRINGPNLLKGLQGLLGRSRGKKSNRF